MKLKDINEKKEIILTQEQLDMIPEYVDRYIKIGCSVSTFTEERCREIIDGIYSLLGKEPVPIKIFPSPKALWRYIESVVGKKLDFIWSYLAGNFDSHIFGYYDFYLDEIKIEIDPENKRKYDIWKSTLELGLIYTFDDICLVSKKPIEIHINKDKVLHCETGPAISYEDGFSVYSLNGVRMKKEYVVTPWDEMDPVIIVKEKNAEVRRELVRKIGIERIIDKLGAKVLDKDGDYELLLLDLKDGRHRPYLKMKNPSIGVYHIEGVHPDCKTVKQALQWRYCGSVNNNFINPLVIT
jgi:hypothetical protein